MGGFEFSSDRVRAVRLRVMRVILKLKRDNVMLSYTKLTKKKTTVQVYTLIIQPHTEIEHTTQ